jgi:1-acyl-sn-glycerol-3-phosphate acyltransferase
MHNVVIEEPYEFIPPYRGKFWAWACRMWLPGHLRKEYGITSHEFRGLELLKASIDAGHGIVLAPNHCRPSDPMAMGLLDIELDMYHYSMASWHVFKQGWYTSFMARRLGAFSVYREGMDRPALNCAIDILATAERPLVIFPEGVISRTNDRLGVLMEGTAFMARQAARKREKQNPENKVVIHPVAIRYLFQGDLQPAVTPVLRDIERRLTWQPQDHRPLVSRIRRVGLALLSLKEVEYLGETQSGSLFTRLERLIDHVLGPLEEEWLGEVQQGDVVARVKNLRMAIVPDMIGGEIDFEERERRWRQLADCYLAQQMSFYPRDYIRPDSPVERLLETVERFEEDLTDDARHHGPQKIIIEVGEAINVSPKRERGGKGDPIMPLLEQRLTAMLEQLATESAPLRKEDVAPSDLETAEQ